MRGRGTEHPRHYPEESTLFVRRGFDLTNLFPYAPYFMGYNEEVKGRFIGHGLGLELDEPPILGPEDKTIIRENMTFSIEINTIIPNFVGQN